MKLNKKDKVASSKYPSLCIGRTQFEQLKQIPELFTDSNGVKYIEGYLGNYNLEAALVIGRVAHHRWPLIL